MQDLFIVPDFENAKICIIQQQITTSGSTIAYFNAVLDKKHR